MKTGSYALLASPSTDTSKRKLKQLRSSVNTVVYEQLDFAIKDDTMFKAYIQEQVIAVVNKILRLEKEQNSQITGE